ncbi:hypothetical protein A3860_25290 [Niastella vici]|uniref:Uncharacterized protein n=1 Tax=Niastella vici TaxID=1703345 RepID=A0A1V9FXZ3_9BACT|nr:hypothetical protein [Niastella vici]OQP63207.1 hypothetical protein A3860_25290 [Niastella vici]
MFPGCWRVLILLVISGKLYAQDSLVKVQNRIVTLKEVVVRNNLNVSAFIERIKNDTTFYKAFRNLKVLGYTSLNDIRMLDKQSKVTASLYSRTRQHVFNGCRHTQVLEEQTRGDIYDKHHEFNYYTAGMYAGLFFAADTICGETNIVKDAGFSTQGKSGLAKHKEQLKMLFFNPGKKIPGIPFIGNKIALFDDEVAARYDFTIDMDAFKGEMCYVFSCKPRADLTDNEKDKIVVNDMTTWFNVNTWEIVARNYDLSYNAGVYDFNVRMEVELAKFGDYLVPKLLRYNGNWDVVMKKRERCIFTATLFDFEK